MAKKAEPTIRMSRGGGRASLVPRGRQILDVTVVLMASGYASTAITPIEVFHSAGQLWNKFQGNAAQPHFRVRTASVDGGSVAGVCSFDLTPECGIEDIKRTDIIVVPGCGLDIENQIEKNTLLLPWLRKWHDKGAYIAGICSGVAFLAEAGLLDGRQATTHWGVAETMRRRYPNVDWRIEQFVTEDGPVFCSGGVYASIDLSLYMVEKFCGREIALQCAKSLLLSMPRRRQSGYSMVLMSPPHSDDKIKQIEKFLHENFDRDLSIEMLSQRVGMGPRNFIRRFKAATGRVPGVYLQMLRVGAAKELLERGAESIQTVCSKIGYADVAFCRTLFKRHTGMTPAEYRSRFAQMVFDRGGPIEDDEPAAQPIDACGA